MSSKLVLFSRFYDRLVALQPALGPLDLEITKTASRTSLGPHVEKAVFFVRIVSTVRISYCCRFSGAVYGFSTVCTN